MKRKYPYVMEFPTTSIALPKFTFLIFLFTHLSHYLLRIVVLIATIVLFINAKESLQDALPVAYLIPKVVVKKSLDQIQKERVVGALVRMGYNKPPVAYVDGIRFGAQLIRAREIDPVLIAVLMDTESQGKITARSNKGYKGLMQTATCTYIPEVDIIHGCKMLDEKLNWKKLNPKKDLRTALALYKGGLSRQAFQQADQVLHKYKKILS